MVYIEDEIKNVIGKELEKHIGHKIKITRYGAENLALECEDCQEVILDMDI